MQRTPRLHLGSMAEITGAGSLIETLCHDIELQTMSTPGTDLEKRKQAALAYVLGWTRSVLSDVLDGDFSPEQVQRILDATSTRRIAESIGLRETDFDVDWERLTDAEKRKIQGYDIA